MPVMNGIEAAPVLRRMMPGTPIVLFSMHADDAVRRIAITAGITHVVSKVNTAALEKCVDDALNACSAGT